MRRLASTFASLTLLGLVLASGPARAQLLGGPSSATAYDFYSASSSGAVLVSGAPLWRPSFGIGVRGTGSILDGGWGTLGVGAELLLRATAHLTLELAGEYQRSDSAPGLDGRVQRIDTPITFGARIHLAPARWVLSPYLVAAGGVDLVSMSFPGGREDAVYIEGQLGAGLELRLGSHFAVLADARLDGRKLVGDPTRTSAPPAGLTLPPLGEGFGFQVRIGTALYF